MLHITAPFADGWKRFTNNETDYRSAFRRGISSGDYAFIRDGKPVRILFCFLFISLKGLHKSYLVSDACRKMFRSQRRFKPWKASIKCTYIQTDNDENLEKAAVNKRFSTLNSLRHRLNAMSEIVPMTPQRTATTYDILMTDEGDVQITHQKWSGDKKGSLNVTQNPCRLFSAEEAGRTRNRSIAKRKRLEKRRQTGNNFSFLFLYFDLKKYSRSSYTREALP